MLCNQDVRILPLIKLLIALSLSAFVMTNIRAEELTLERIFASPDLSGASLRQARLSPAGDRVSFLQGRADDRTLLDVWEYNLNDDTTRRLVAADQILADEGELSTEEQARRERARIADLRGIVEYRWSDDGRNLLFPLGGNLYYAEIGDVADGESANVLQLTGSESFDTDPKVAPDGRHVAFIRDQNLWLVDIESAEARALTTDGRGTIKNGMAEFIAQEEMGRATGYWWSPDGRMIAFLQIDESPIEPSTRFEVSGDAISMIEQRYPYAGTSNVRYRLGVIEVDNAETILWVNLLDDDGNDDIYIPRVNWLPDSSGIAFQRQSRSQQQMDLILHRLADNSQTLLVRETSDTWINLHDDLRFLSEMPAFIWSSERSGYRHLYLIGLNGELIRPLTEGNWPVDALAGVDEELGRVYFTAFKQSPTEQHLFRQSLATETPSDVVKLSRRAGWHEISMDSGAQYYLD
ncbi:MAG: DPP IV N-terminal domain-containing protein, partial [Pseudomonadota bacterium]